MIVLDHPQRSIEWIAARCWRLTASRMPPIILSSGKLSKSEAATTAIDKLIAGIDLAAEMNSRADELAQLDDWQLKRFMSHYTGEKFTGSSHTERGNDLEPDAVAALAERIGEQPSDVGMCVMGNNKNGVVSCSPDGLIGCRKGSVPVSGCEVKSPCLANYYRYVADGVLPDDYKLQVHASMVICETSSWHFAAYFPGKPLFHVVVRRDSFTEILAQSLAAFRDCYSDRYDLVTRSVSRLGKEAA